MNTGLMRKVPVKYPHLLERILSRVAALRSIQFETANAGAKLSAAWRGLDDNELIVQVPEGFSGSDADLRDFIVAFLTVDTAKTQRDMCLVTSPEFCIYVKPDGRIIPTSQVPAGGMIINLIPEDDSATDTGSADNHSLAQ